MAGSRSSGRRQQASREDQQQRLILMGAGAILVIVLVIVAIGVITAWYMPPRAQVLTVGERDFTARQVADRAHYLVYAGSEAAQRDPVDEAATSLTRQEVLIQAGPALVGDVTDEDIQMALAENLQLGEGYTAEEVEERLAGYLGVSPITRTDLLAIVRAGVVEERLIEHFQGELPEAGDQMHLVAVRTTNRGLAREFVDLVRGGRDYMEVAVEMELASMETGAPLVGWYAPETLPARIAPGVANLREGEISDPIEDPNGIWVDIFQVTERTSDEPYVEAVRVQLAERAFREWMDEQEAIMQVQRDFSTSDTSWIRRQVQAALRG